MTTLHEDAHVEEAEQAEQVAEVTGGATGGVAVAGCLTGAASKVDPEAAAPQPLPTTADKCQAASTLQPKEHHLEQPLQPHALTVSNYKFTPIYWSFFFSIALFFCISITTFA